jgi:plastocyanin domain-containing protein
MHLEQSLILRRTVRSRRAVASTVAPLIAVATMLGACAPKAADPSHATIAIQVTEDGFTPRVTTAPRGVPVTLVVTRRTNQTCATDIVIAGMDQKWELPLDRAVRIEVPQGVRDTLRYACGMDMFHGIVVAK